MTVRTIDLAIGGMTCAGCAARVEKALKAAPGVGSAEVNLAMARARVSGRVAATSPRFTTTVRKETFGSFRARHHQTPNTPTRAITITVMIGFFRIRRIVQAQHYDVILIF